MFNVKLKFKDMTNVQIYVGTYFKYNNGSVEGAWPDLKDYSNYEELSEAMRELHKDEEDPEFMFQDYECSEIFNDLKLISESYISKDIYEVIEAIENSYHEEEVITAFIYCYGNGCNDIHDVLNKVCECYCGEFSDDIDFTEQLLADTGCLSMDLPSYVHIDWGRTAQDIMMDYVTYNHHYFRLM
tara:strand:+ start:57 stop:611 length:555 start_codon:yes stop_codon:yes gene_type:complete